MSGFLKQIHYEITRNRNIWVGVVLYSFIFIILREIHRLVIAPGARVFLSQSAYPPFMAGIPQELMRQGDTMYVGLIKWWQPVVCFIVDNGIYRSLAFCLLVLLSMGMVYKTLIEDTEYDPHYKE